MKMALVHDYLCGIGGAERVFRYICEEFPEADIYTLAFNPERTYPFFSTRNIRTTWLDTFIRSMNSFRWSFPLATHVMERVDLREYDLVFSSSATVAKYVVVPNGEHICYCYFPTRAIWQFDDYFGQSLKAKFLKMFLPYLQKRDFQASQRVDQFIAISNTSRDYIRAYYNRDSQVIHSPIDLRIFEPSAIKKEHYLIASRLERWKRIDYAIEAFNKLRLPLRIIGTGDDESRLKSMAKSNIKFLGLVDDATLAKEYSEALAVVFTPFLEYGLTPLEANASGTPVICFGKGGVVETMINWASGNASSRPPTAIFFYEQTAGALIEAVRQFEGASFKSVDLVRHASQWNVSSFREKLRHLVSSLNSI